MQVFVSDAIASPPDFASFYAAAAGGGEDRGGLGSASLEVGVSSVTRGGYGLPADAIILCNFNQLFKVDPLVFDTWMRLLTQVPAPIIICI